MARISLEADTTKVNAFLDAFPRQTAKAIPRATKRGATSAMTLTKRLASKDMGLKSRDVAKRLKLRRRDAFTYEIRASSTRVPLIEFSAKGPRPSRGRGRGVSYRIGRGRKTQRKAFIARIGRREGVHARVGQARTPTRELRGPSVGRVMDLHKKEILAKASFEIERELDRLLDRIIGGRVA